MSLPPHIQLATAVGITKIWTTPYQTRENKKVWLSQQKLHFSGHITMHASTKLHRYTTETLKLLLKAMPLV